MNPIRPEDELILRCARMGTEPTNSEPIEELLRENVDWAYLLRTARRHGLMLLLYPHFARIESDIVPKNTKDYLRDEVEYNSQRNIFFTQELLELVNLFQAQGIPAIPLRGPVSIAARHSSPGLWEFKELNILVREEDVLKVKELLIARQYDLPFAPHGKCETTFLKYQYQYVFYHSKPLLPNSGHPVLILHWRLVPRYFPCQPDWSEMWDNLERISIDGWETPTLSPVDSLCMLCGHGAQGLWERLDWIYEVAELIRVHHEIDWERLLERARGFGSERLVLLGLSLAHGLLKTALPEKVRQRMQSDPIVKSLGAQVREQMFQETEYAPGIRRRYSFLFKALERRIDRVKYCRWTLLTPGAREWRILPRPDLIFPLYSVFRPFLLIGKYGMSLLQPRMPAGFERFAPTEMRIVEQMIKVADVRPTDVVYDLGCGDGRVVITAAKRYGARGVGIDIDPRRIAEAKARARAEKVEHLVRFIQEDARKLSLSEATVVIMYIGWELSLKLRPLLQAQLKAGARIVSLNSDMGDWPPTRTKTAEDVDGETNIFYLWQIK